MLFPDNPPYIDRLVYTNMDLCVCSREREREREREMALKIGLWDVVPFAVMVMVECAEVGITTLSKAAMVKGMSHFVFIVYYNALGTLILLPSFLLRRNKRPPLTFSILCRFFLLALIGICLRQICAFSGISLSSPTLASALGNLIPAFTFVLAVIFRMERVDLRRGSSRARVMGTIASVGGAFIVTLYKGPPVMMIINKTTAAALDPSVPHLLNHHYFSEPSSSNWVLGGFFIVLTCIFSALWNILQTTMVKDYRDETTVVFFYCLFGTIQCAVVSLFIERDISTWILKTRIELIAILYSAIIGAAVTSAVLTWCLRKKGPIYVAMYKPLGIVIAVIMGVIFLGDVLHIGSVIGAVVIVLGFYAVMWGQAKEEKMVVDENRSCGVSNSGPSTLKDPLLPS
ncbi:WAT1-related protein At3g28050-like [Macadamia integrifolia]|uniref:WAT1-related protein At3g28050-like n=1 Tax=Macadamia integrifolia TaxID=60698 RepID=UPI001C4E899E|nr:WAT1-related protein At3g28050-like [Macadamia integrifolia]